jgi:hypothetical protein
MNRFLTKSRKYQVLSVKLQGLFCRKLLKIALFFQGLPIENYRIAARRYTGADFPHVFSNKKENLMKFAAENGSRWTVHGGRYTVYGGLRTIDHIFIRHSA